MKLLWHAREDRGMTLIEEQSRCVRAGELHEIVMTDADALVGGRVDRVRFLGFAEVLVAGVIDVGDRVTVGDRSIGHVIGFDACHFPNHYNVLIRAENLTIASELDLALGDPLTFSEAAVHR